MRSLVISIFSIFFHDKLLTLMKKRKVRWFGHVSRSSGLAKTTPHGTVKRQRKRGRQKKRKEGNITQWTGMDFASSTRAAENRTRWKGIIANSSWVLRRPSKENRIEIVYQILRWWLYYCLRPASG